MTTAPSVPKRENPPHVSGDSTEHEIFFDPTCRRWRYVKIFAGMIVLLAIMVIGVSWQPLQQPTALGNGKVIPPMPHLNLEGRTPEIGVGPLARLVRVEHRGTSLIAVDPVTNRPLGAITGDDADQVGNANYALQHYGYSSAAHKTLELTFDDGPDPTWTPQILDVLSHYKAAATFFVVGSEVVKYPDIVKREAREGFAVANHTLTHPDLTTDTVQQQLVFNDRIIRASTGIATNLIRLPFDGSAGHRMDSDRNAIMVDAERLGYIVSFDEFDTNDWKYGDPALRPRTPIPLPSANVDNLTILLHDGGGNRSATVAYVKRLIPWALAHGFSFHSLPQVSPQVVAGARHISPSVWDYETLWLYQALWVWPNALIAMLFVLALISVVAGGGMNATLAVIRRARYVHRWVHQTGLTNKPGARRAVSVAIAAYNEEKVIGRTLQAICRSRYANLREIIVVDDGSSDRTRDIVVEMAASDPRIRLLRQKHGGKAAALNWAFAMARSPIVVTLDADTIFTPTTVGNLVRHFVHDTSQRLGAVAGVIKVGNLRNLLTRWQALDYITMINIDRGAQDALHAIMVAPGACAAWSRRAVLRVGGYSRSTLAEDCDLVLELQQAGYSVTQDDEAVCYTEAPETVRALAKQRYRWMYGNIQAMWKHRRMIFNPRYGWLGMLTLPVAVISVLMPLVFLPFVYAMAAVTFEGQGMSQLLLYVAIFVAMQLLTSGIGVWLARERPSHLLMAPLYKVIYEPLRAYILYKSTLTILRGAQSRWNKLQRMGTVTVASSEPKAGAAWASQ